MGVKVRVGQQTGVKVPTTSSTAGGTVASLQDTDVSNVVNGSVPVSYTHLTLPTTPYV